jgi:hypothetical protein
MILIVINYANIKSPIPHKYLKHEIRKKKYIFVYNGVS